MNLGRFFKNIAYLTKVDLKKANTKLNSTVSQELLHDILDNYKYEIAADINQLPKPTFHSFDNCIHNITNHKYSLCRFGDGELNLCQNLSIPFQKASEKLAQRMIEVLSSDIENIMIAVPEHYYSERLNLKEINRRFSRLYSNTYIKIINKHRIKSKIFYPAEISLAYTFFETYDFEDYFRKISSIWKNKDITIICGKTIFDKIENNIFDCAKSVEYQHAPSMDAFESYDEILTQARTIDKNRLVIIILGPTATILAYDLAREGYQALDMGHIAKSYDWYVKSRKTDNIEEAYNFFNPD